MTEEELLTEIYEAILRNGYQKAEFQIDIKDLSLMTPHGIFPIIFQTKIKRISTKKEKTYDSNFGKGSTFPAEFEIDLKQGYFD